MMSSGCDANLRVSTADISGFQQVELPDISWWVAQEAVSNVLVHWDYFMHQAMHLTLHDDRAEVTSPRGIHRWGDGPERPAQPSPC